MLLQSLVVGAGGEGGLYVVDNRIGGFQGSEVKCFIFSMGNSQDNGIVARLGEGIVHLYAVFVPSHFGVGPGVVDGNVHVVVAQRLYNVDHFGIAYIGAVLLKGKAENQHMGIKHLNAFFEHQFNHLVRYVGSHSVVHASSGEDDFGVIAVPLCALC